MARDPTPSKAEVGPRIRAGTGEAVTGALKIPTLRADGYGMRHASVRGFGIRYFLAMTLPVTGLVLVLYTIVQLVIAQTNGIQPAQRPMIARASIATPVEAPGPSVPALLRD